jgi:hypothetical protein
MHGAKIDNAMGVNTWMAFAGSDDNALVDGDFAVTEDELQSALKAMRVGGINIVAIHSHMTHEQRAFCFFTTGAEVRPKNWRKQFKGRFWPQACPV